jgi:hypothetical protein
MCRSQRCRSTRRADAEKARFADQGVCPLRPAVCLAQEVGALLGTGALLQSTLPQSARPACGTAMTGADRPVGIDPGAGWYTFTDQLLGREEKIDAL